MGTPSSHKTHLLNPARYTHAYWVWLVCPVYRERRLCRTVLRGVENPRQLARIFRVLHGFCGDVLNLARARSRCAKFSTHAFMKLRFAKFSKFGAKFSTDGSIQVDLSAPQVSPWRPAAGLYCVPAVQSLHCALAVVCSAALSGLLRALCRPSQVSDCCVSSLCSALGLGLEPGTSGT